MIQRRPWPALAVGAASCSCCSRSRSSALRLGFGDAGNRRPADTTRRAYDLLSEGFGPGFNGPLLLVAELAAAGTSTSTALDGAVRRGS